MRRGRGSWPGILSSCPGANDGLVRLAALALSLSAEFPEDEDGEWPDDEVDEWEDAAA